MHGKKSFEDKDVARWVRDQHNNKSNLETISKEEISKYKELKKEFITTNKETISKLLIKIQEENESSRCIFDLFLKKMLNDNNFPEGKSLFDAAKKKTDAYRNDINRLFDEAESALTEEDCKAIHYIAVSLYYKICEERKKTMRKSREIMGMKELSITKTNKSNSTYEKKTENPPINQNSEKTATQQHLKVSAQ